MTPPTLAVVLGSHTIFCSVIKDGKEISILPKGSREMSDTVIWNESWYVKQPDGKQPVGNRISKDNQEIASITSPQLFLGKSFDEIIMLNDQYTGVQVFPKGDEEVVFEVESHYYSLMSIIKVQFSYMLAQVKKTLGSTISNCVVAIPFSIKESKKVIDTLTVACKELNLTISTVMDPVPLTYLYLKKSEVDIDKESKYYLVIDWKYRCLFFVLMYVEKSKGKFVITPVTHWDIPFIGYGEVLLDLCSLIEKKMGSTRHFKCSMNEKSYSVRDLAKEIIPLFIESEKKREYRDYSFSYMESGERKSTEITHRDLCLLVARHQRRMMYGLNQALDAWGLTADAIDCVITNGRLCGLPSSINEINRFFSFKSICNYSLRYYGILDGLVAFSQTNEGEEGNNSRLVGNRIWLDYESGEIVAEEEDKLPFSRSVEIKVDSPSTLQLFVNNTSIKSLEIREDQCGPLYLTLTVTHQYQILLFVLHMPTNTLLCDFTAEYKHFSLC